MFVRTEARDWPAVIDHARRALAIDPLRDRTYHTLIPAYAYLGDRAAALSTYAACQQVLQAEPGVARDP